MISNNGNIQQAKAVSNAPVPKRSSLREEFAKALSIEGKAKRTIDAYVEAISRYVEFHRGMHPLQSTVNHVRAYLFHLKEEQKYAARTYNQQLYGLKSFFGIFMPDIPLMESFCRLKVRDGNYTFITRHEFDELVLHTRNIKHQAILSVLYGTGVRVSECAAITFSDMDRKEGLLKVMGKGEKIRYTLLPKTTVSLLERYYKSCRPKTYLFEGREGKPLSTHMIEYAVSGAAKRAGIKKKLHRMCYGIRLRRIF